jgi:hypothetical protein
VRTPVAPVSLSPARRGIVETTQPTSAAKPLAALLTPLILGLVFVCFSRGADQAVRIRLLGDILNARPQPAWQGKAAWLDYIQVTRDDAGHLRPADDSNRTPAPYHVRYFMLRDLPSLVQQWLKDPIHQAENNKAVGSTDLDFVMGFNRREADEEYGYYGTGWYGHADFEPAHNARDGDGKLLYVPDGYSWRGGIYVRGGPAIDGQSGAFRRPHGVIWHDYDVELFTHGTLLVLFFLTMWHLQAVPRWFAISASLYVTLLAIFMYFSTIVVERVHPLFFVADFALPLAATAFPLTRYLQSLSQRAPQPARKEPAIIALPAPRRTLDRSAEVLESAAKRMTPSPESARLLRAAQALRTADSIRVLKDDIGEDFDDPAIQKALQDAGIRFE